MIIRQFPLALALACFLLPVPATAQDFPALYRVSGVITSDVLNLRATPDAAADIVGMLPPDATHVEVLDLSADGNWALIGTGEASGWAALRYLIAEGGTPWWQMDTPVQCHGTEPFWALRLNVPVMQSAFNRPGRPEMILPTSKLIASTSPTPQVGLKIGQDRPNGFVVLTGETCSDGMSDRVQGISASVFLFGESDGTPDGIYRGCCSLAP